MADRAHNPDEENHYADSLLVEILAEMVKSAVDWVTITTGKYAGQTATIESNAYQRTVDFPGEGANGYHVMLDIEELVAVGWD